MFDFNAGTLLASLKKGEIGHMGMFGKMWTIL